MSENKITEEQLKDLQELVGKLNNASTQLGNLELQKHQILHAAGDVQSDLNKLQVKLEKAYGKVQVNIKDGTFEPIEESGAEVVEE
jgi:hypothetical protein